MNTLGQHNQIEGEETQSDQLIKDAFSKLKGRLEEITEDIERRNEESAL